MMGNADEPSFRTFRQPSPDFDTFCQRMGATLIVTTSNFPRDCSLGAGFWSQVLVILALYVQRVRARRRLADVPWVDPRPAHVIANESLERLAAENLPEQGEILSVLSSTL